MLRKLIGWVFAPATGAMNRLWYWQKFAVLTIFFTIPVGFALHSFIIQVDTNIAFAEKEIVGVQYISPALSLLQDMQQHRGIASLYLRGDQSFLPHLVEKEKNIEADFALLNTADRQFGQELGTDNMVSALHEKWLILQRENMQMTPVESARRHTLLISEILTLIRHAGDTSNLILDSDLDSYYLMNSIVNTLPDLSEDLGQARAFTLSIQNTKKISDAERRDVINRSRIAVIASEKLDRDIGVAFAHDPSLRDNLEQPVKETLAAVKSFSLLLDTFVNTSKIEMPLPDYYAFATSVINTNFSLAQSLSASLVSLLQKRIDGFRAEKQKIIYITIASYLLILYVFAGFYLLVVRTVRTFEDIAAQLVSGKTAAIPTLSRDELGEAGKSFNAVGQELIASNNEILLKAQEFQKQSNDLAHLNQFMVNREVKMSELKDEMRRLRDALSRRVAQSAEDEKQLP